MTVLIVAKWAKVVMYPRPLVKTVLDSYLWCLCFSFCVKPHFHRVSKHRWNTENANCIQNPPAQKKLK